jgi:hypothetical protein
MVMSLLECHSSLAGYRSRLTRLPRTMRTQADPSCLPSKKTIIPAWGPKDHSLLLIDRIAGGNDLLEKRSPETVQDSKTLASS